MKEKVRIVLSCSASCSDSLEIVKADWGDGPEYFVSLRVDAFYAGQNVRGIIWERIKFAWEALRKGNYIHAEIVTDREALTRLRDELTSMLSDPNTASDVPWTVGDAQRT